MYASHFEHSKKIACAFNPPPEINPGPLICRMNINEIYKLKMENTCRPERSLVVLGRPFLKK